MKHCPNCQLTKDDSEFAKNVKRRDGLQAYCKLCKRDRDKIYYAANPKEASKRKNIATSILSEELDIIKSNLGCAICPETNPCCLDFHHIDAKVKSDNVGTLAKQGSRIRAFAEIKKCIVLCANHHRQLHAGYIVALVGSAARMPLVLSITLPPN